ncbi:MAG TPA: type II toxin-antitoxin system VapC family toxin [Chthoniobacteraceae bacterium]|nr:type II toxin-antitoxin system VapC family toxin [Chthoniobacteraceae bacterium]
MPQIGKALLDTSVVIPYMKGDAAIRAQIQQVTTLCLPITAAGELYCGAYTSQFRARLLVEIKNFLKGVVLLTHRESTAEIYGEIRAELAKAGTPIPENDIWIAALAKEEGIPLATRDAHFQRVKGINILAW